MAYNNVYPATYPQQYYSTPIIGTPAQQSQSGIIWVQGEAGAKSYLVAPNTTVQLWDSESQTIYLKSADASGMPSMKVLDYTIRQAASQAPQNVTPTTSNINYKEDISALQGQIDAIKEELKAIKKPAKEKS